ncbi:9609_t:CDS:2, partial [Paraglomus occultum]
MSLPVFHEELNKFVAIVNLFHVMKYLMLHVYTDLNNRDELEYDKKTRNDVINLFKDTVSDIIDSWGAYAFPVHLADDPLLEVMQEFILKPNTYAILVDTSQPREKTGSDTQRVSVLTQRDAINYILNDPELRECVQDVPAKNVIQRSWKTFTERDDPNQLLHRLPVSNVQSSYVLYISHLVSALTGFRSMAIHGVSSMAVVDKQDGSIKLLDNLSASDIRHFTEDTMSDVFLPVSDYLKKVRKSERKLVVCYEDTPLREVMELAVKNSVHRVWVIEQESEKPVGEISMTDMLAMYA